MLSASLADTGQFTSPDGCVFDILREAPPASRQAWIVALVFLGLAVLALLR